MCGLSEGSGAEDKIMPDSRDNPESKTTEAQLESALDLIAKIADCASDPWPSAVSQCQDIAKWATDFLFPEGVKHG